MGEKGLNQFFFKKVLKKEPGINQKDLKIFPQD
jgi:hypothetical protein